MQIMTQFSVFMVNKPGMLASVCDAIAHARINIIAITVTDSSEHGVMRLVVSKPEQLRELLDKLNRPYTETEVLSVVVSNRTGILSDIFQLLGESHVNVHYAYASSGAPGGKTTCILHSNDNKKASKLLERLENPKGKKKITVKNMKNRNKRTVRAR